ncbi:unnamed protein product [Meganyctiphanes norvegica]|uniref:Uncharacterized protein n=1 Tax=Meganyctiphanes norvegica TaxID=48144 RepID=A0AAV2SB14_MEGNR
MATRTIDMDPIEMVDILREKLIKAKQEGKLSQAQIDRLMPPSLRKRDQHNIPAYQVGSLKKQQEETKDKISKKGAGRAVPQVQQNKYLKQFSDAKSQGRFSHLSESMIKKLEDEVRTSAGDASKQAELEEFFRSIYSEDVE